MESLFRMDATGTTLGESLAQDLAQRLAQRTADAQAAESRLDQKLSQLAKAEQTLHGLLESLRHAVSEACPLVGELRGYRESAKATVSEVVATAREQFAQVIALVRSRMDLLKEAEKRFAGTVEAWESSARQRAAGLGKELYQQVEPAIEMARARVREMSDGLPMLLAEKLEEFRKQADITLGLAEERVARRVEEFETKSGIFEEWLEAEMQRAREALDGLLTQQQARAQHVEASLAEVIERSMIKAADLAGAVENSLAGAADEVKARVLGSLDEVASEVEERARETVAMAKLVTARHVTQAGEQVEHKCIEARQAMAGALDEFDQTLRLNLAQIAAAGESALAAAEERLAVRVRDLRPGVWRAVQQAEADALRRLAKVDETLRAGVELSEREFMDRLAVLRPKAVSALKGMEAELARRAAELEAEGAAITAWLERRLAERAAAAVDRARRVIHQEIEDEARNPVEVSVFIQGNGLMPAQRESAA